MSFSSKPCCSQRSASYSMCACSRVARVVTFAMPLLETLCRAHHLAARFMQVSMLSACLGHEFRACMVRAAASSCRFQKRLAEHQDKTRKTHMCSIRIFSNACARVRQKLRRMWNATQHFRWTSSNSPLHWLPTCNVAPRRRKRVPSAAGVMRDSKGCEAFIAGYPSVWGKCGAARATEHLSQRCSNPTSVSATTASSLIMRSRLWHEVEKNRLSSAQAG